MSREATCGKINIRPATPADAAALAEIHIASWRAAYRGLVPDSYLDGLDRERRAQRFRDSLARNAEESYLAERDGKPLGILTLGGCRDQDVDPATTGEIWGIYLAPEYWRQGIGTWLCRHGEKILQARGYRAATLWVFAGNGQARRFYEALGFAAEGATKTLQLGAPLEAVRYRKELGGAEPGAPAEQVRSPATPPPAPPSARPSAPPLRWCVDWLKKLTCAEALRQSLTASEEPAR